jgi:hypothetical protein
VKLFSVSQNGHCDTGIEKTVLGVIQRTSHYQNKCQSLFFIQQLQTNCLKQYDNLSVFIHLLILKLQHAGHMQKSNVFCHGNIHLLK